MTTPRRALLLLVPATLLVCALADAYAVHRHLPYALGGHGRPDQVGADWPSHGTALGPPLLPFVLLAVGAVLLALPGRAGRVGDVVLALVGVLLLLGTLGEPSTWHSTAPVQVVVRLLTTLLSVGLVVTAVRDWRSRHPLGRTSPVS